VGAEEHQGFGVTCSNSMNEGFRRLGFGRSNDWFIEVINFSLAYAKERTSGRVAAKTINQLINRY